MVSADFPRSYGRRAEIGVLVGVCVHYIGSITIRPIFCKDSSNVIIVV